MKAKAHELCLDWAAVTEYPGVPQQQLTNGKLVC